MAKFVNLKDALIKKESYGSNDRLALIAYDKTDGEMLTVLSVNIVNYPILDKKREVFIKDWSENEGVLEELIQMEIVKPEYQRVPTGFTSAALCTLTEKFFLS